MIEAFVPRALSPDDCNDLSLIAGRLGRGSFRLAGGEWHFELSPAVGLPALPSQTYVLTIEWGGARLRLLAASALFALIYATRFPGLDTSAQPPTLALAAADLAGREIIERLEQLSGRRVKLVGIDAAHDVVVGSGELIFALQLASDDEVRDGIDCWLGVDPSALSMLALLARRQPAQTVVPSPETPARIRLEVGETRLRLGQLRELRPHDVVMLDATYCNGREVRLCLRTDGRHRLLARAEAKGLIAETCLETTPMTANDLNMDDEEPASIEDIEVHLSFDLGERIMTVAELAAINPGSVVALDSPLARCVYVRANGRLIGRGEIVQIDDAIGVRVMNLASSREPE